MRLPSISVVKFMVFVLVLAGLACSVPFIGSATPTPTPTPTIPTPTPEPTPRGDLPPALVETFPPSGAEVPLDGPVVFAFNQPMDRESVEAAFQSATGLAGRFEWLDDQTLWFYPDSTLAPGTELDVTIGASAQAANGRGLLAPINIRFLTVGYLRLAQALPEPGSGEVNPAAAVVAAFNRPVVALGAEPGSLPAAFRLEPAAEGRGEWLNTSTYVFYPNLALQGGLEYRVILDDDLVGVDGAPLDGVGIAADSSLPPGQSFTEWTFRTAAPQVIGVSPTSDLPLGLDGPFSIQFNQPMDQASSEANFALQGPDGRVSGEFGWDASFTTLVFTPTNQLNRDTQYTLRLAGAAQAAGGTPLGNDLQQTLVTYPDFGVAFSLPEAGGVLNPQASIQMFLTSPPPASDLTRFVNVSPRVTNMYAWFSDYDSSLVINGDFKPGTEYTATLSPDMADRWQQPLGSPFSLQFSVSDYPASIQVQGAYGGSVIFAPSADRGLAARALNLSSAALTVGSISVDQFLNLATSGVFDAFQNYVPPDTQTFEASFNLPRNIAQDVLLPLSANRIPLTPGLYHIRIDSVSQDTPTPFALVVSDVQLAFKLSATEALVWAVHSGDLTPVVDAPVLIYDENGQQVAAGRTDASGLFRSVVPIPADPYATRYAMVGEPGLPDFSLALSNWEQGIAGWEMGLPTDFTRPHTLSYFYTDRPIYRPGDVVNFRGVLRSAYNGRYEMPDLSRVNISVTGGDGTTIQELDLDVSEFGTVSGSFALSPNAQPGYYAINNITEPENYGGVSFLVAEYRAPEINLDLSTSAADLLAGENFQANLQASYFFGPPAAGVTIDWAFYRRTDRFDLPGYVVGPRDPDWADTSFQFPPDFLGEDIARGSGTTDAQGGFNFDFETPLPDQPVPAGTTWRFTLEVTARDEAGLPVSERAASQVHPSVGYIGLAARSGIGMAGESFEFDVLSVDWTREPLPGRSLTAEFSQVVTTATGETNPDGSQQYETSYTPIAEQTVQTDAHGMALLRFTPPEPGTYRLSAQGDGARTDLFVWVSGPGTAAYPDLPNQNLVLVPDKESYQPGETASLLIPNPFNRPTPALITVERGTLLEAETITLPAGGDIYTLAVSEEDAPNVYVTALLLDSADFRYGVQNLPVTPLAQTLTVELVTQPERTGPGDEVTFSLRVTDYQGQPVQGEFSLAVVNEAVLALTGPNSSSILDAFYREQPLGVRTGVSMAAYSGRAFSQVGGMGGGGDSGLGFMLPRSDFRDTAYWNGTIITDPDGTAEVSAVLPDNLTTWQVDVRGLDDQTLVGDAQASLLTTKDLLVRPVTPRFLVVGDHVQLAAVVQNNTASSLDGSVNLQAQGISLDDAASVTQAVSLLAGGRQRIEWWGTVDDVTEVDLLFSAQAGGLEDATTPERGPIPVLRYSAPQVFGTSGVLDEGGERLEVVSLPLSFDPQGGDLRLEMSPSLAAAVLDALDTLETFPYPSTEQAISSFLPNLATYQVLQSFGLEQPELQTRLDRTLDETVKRLLATQNADGGWSWWPGNGTSEPYMTAYVIFGLSQMRASGDSQVGAALDRGVAYLKNNLPTASLETESWQLDQLAFELFSLAGVDQATRDDIRFRAQDLYTMRERLSPWAGAYLALAFEPGSRESQELLSGLQASALRSDTGVHWEESNPTPQNLSTPVQTTSVVIYALAQRDPAASLLPDAVRYVMSHRTADGGWLTTYESAWTVLAMAEVMRGTGELSGDFGFSAAVNDIPVAEGNAAGAARLSPVVAAVPVGDLFFRSPNAVVFERDPGTGRMYYTLHLNLLRPVEEVQALNQGVSVQRVYYPAGGDCPEGCEPVSSGQEAGLVEVHLTVTLPEDAYYLVVEDYLPAGAEVVDGRLKTSQLGSLQFEFQEPVPLYEATDPLAGGWGWWLFNDPRVYDDRIGWTADYLPAGTYELTYVMALNQQGEYRVLPARAFELYFPEVGGSSEGQLFTIGE